MYLINQHQMCTYYNTISLASEMLGTLHHVCTRLVFLFLNDKILQHFVQRFIFERESGLVPRGCDAPIPDTIEQYR